MAQHQLYSCPLPCSKVHCPYCDGGLAVCTMCLCAEGELATECPGTMVDPKFRALIYDGAIDWRDGRWTTGTTATVLFY